MTTIANCFDIQEALRLQMALASADIPSFIPDEATAQNAPWVFVGSGAGVRLQVEEEHAVEAQKIVEDARPKASVDEPTSEDAVQKTDEEDEQRI